MESLPGIGSVETGTPDGRASLTRGGSLVAPALTLVNVVGYVLTVFAARTLDKDAYGELNALLGVLLVLSVPALALQVVVARSIARRPVDEVRGARERVLLERSAVLGVAFSAVLAALSPLLAAFLHTSVEAQLWVAVQLVPFALVSAAMGILQGAEHFRALAAIIVAQALGKAVGVLPLLAHGSAVDVIAALAGGMLLTLGVALAVVGPRSRGEHPGDLPDLRSLRHAVGGLLAVLLLANLDVLLARHVLAGGQSGRYSAGAVLAKAAFWLPQAVAVVVFPRLSDPEGGRLVLRNAVRVVAALGLLEVLGCLALARPALEITFGPSYGSLSPIAPLWVVQGAALAVVQLLVYRAIATHDVVVSRVIGVGAVVETVLVLVLDPRSPGPVIVVASAVAVTVAAGLLVRARGGPQPR